MSYLSKTRCNRINKCDWHWIAYFNRSARAVEDQERFGHCRSWLGGRRSQLTRRVDHKVRMGVSLGDWRSNTCFCLDKLSYTKVFSSLDMDKVWISNLSTLRPTYGKLVLFSQRSLALSELCEDASASLAHFSHFSGARSDQWSDLHSVSNLNDGLHHHRKSWDEISVIGIAIK